MKNIILFAAAAAVVSTPAFAAPGDTADATGAATAEVVAPISITHTANAVLDFGTFSAGTAAGTVVVTQGGVATDGGDVTLLSGSSESADAFDVAGGASRTFAITTGAGTVDFGTFSMAFTTDAPASGTLDASGDASFSVGGTLSVGADQEPGVYTGDYTVTVAYN